MSESSWKQRIYDSYMSNGFQDSHNMNREFDLQNRYFCKNYLKFMPQDKNCKILELGCGMGHFYNFCRQAGYINYEGIDVSGENVSYMKKIFGEDVKASVNDIMAFISSNSLGGGTMSSYLMM